MKSDYTDITDKLGTPLWWDEVGAPRYAPFRPNMTNNIYAREVALLRIQCQSCQRPFDVCMSWFEYEKLRNSHSRPLKERVKDGTIHYGDPPNYGCCPAGATMNCDDIKVLEFWELVSFEWVRRPEFEINLDTSNSVQSR